MKETITLHQIHFNLESLLEDCWHRLINGTLSAKNPFHQPVVATVNDAMPELRTVVLRKAIPEEKALIFHTDFRSPKVNQLKKNNSISWLFYDAKARIQLRIKSEATLHYKDDLALHRWKETRLESRKCYLVHPGPSTFAPLPTDGLDASFMLSPITEERSAIGFDNFTVVKCTVSEIDWLFLNHAGHRRALFTYGKDHVQKHWLIP